MLTRAQARAGGLTDEAIRWRLASNRWTSPHRGVYVTHPSDLSWHTRASAAVHYAGDGTALAMLSAAYLHRLVDRPPPNIVVMIPLHRRLDNPARVLFLRRRHIDTTTAQRLAVTTVEQTVLDLGSIGTRLDEAIGYAATAVQRKLTTSAALSRALADRNHHRWRQGLRLALGDIAIGAESVLEVRYRRDVERRHGLPQSRMQAPDRSRGCSIRRDFLYEDYGLVVEVDGRVGHVGAGVSRDRRRDRSSARKGLQTLRCGWAEVTYETCDVALDVGLTLNQRGWTGRARACGDGCAVG